MLTTILLMIGGSIIGAIIARPSEKRCGAFTEARCDRHAVHDHYRCKERSDPRCEAGYCTLHCRQTERCNALCLRAQEAVAKELTP